MIYYLAAALYYTAVFLRTLLIYQKSPELSQALILLVVLLVLFVSEPTISRRWSSYFPFYLLLQTSLVFLLLALPGSSDFFATLLGILSMQVMLNLNLRAGAVWIGACALIMGLLMVRDYGPPQALALTLIFTASNAFLGTYALIIRREQAAQNKKIALADELRTANLQLQDYSLQLEQLSVARERNRFTRELHDSVTQTVFSMTLTTQSAIMLFKRDPQLVSDQLERLSQLVSGALVEMEALISKLKPEQAAGEGLVSALRRHLADKHIIGDLSVSFSVEGNQTLSAPDERALFGIAQEALNNIRKHAGTDQALVRLHLDQPYWMEIEDHGIGFDLGQARQGGRLGLTFMNERAAEVGWNLQVITSPGAGTRIRVEKPSISEVQL